MYYNNRTPLITVFITLTGSSCINIIIMMMMMTMMIIIIITNVASVTSCKNGLHLNYLFFTL